MNNNLIPIESKHGITVYGRIIGNGGRLGQYQVYASFNSTKHIVYHNYSEAQKQFKWLVSVYESRNVK